jgi:hypothetical protein
MTETDTPLININSSTKIEKGLTQGWYTGILYLKPADMVAKKTLCPFADQAGCKAGCLESSGQLGMATADKAKIKRTILMLLQPLQFIQALQAEVDRYHIKYGDKLAIRLNGTSDLDWFDFIKANPLVQFYDYTKVIKYARKSLDIANYHVTFSGSAASVSQIDKTIDAIKEGLQVVIACNTAENKGEWRRPEWLGDISLLDMDTTDLRFLDKGQVGTLKRKGSNRKERTDQGNAAGFFFSELRLAWLGIKLNRKV